jgi:NADP-dependent 3-hydroxy acid dehydrogenase YdfG
MSHSKIAIVTGAGTGVGKAAALALLADGWQVALIGRRLQLLEDVAASSHSPESCLPLSVDVANPDAVKNAFAKVMSNKDVLGNNGNLSLQLYVKQTVADNEHNTQDLIADIKIGQKQINDSLDNLYTQLKEIGIEV